MKNLFIPTKQNNYKPYLLRKVCLVIYTIILVVVNSFGGIFGISQVSASSITSANIIALTNQERSSAGLNILNSNSQLAQAAMAKAQNMFDEQYWDHFGPNGETPWQFIIAAGYSYVYAGENLAKGFRTAEGVVEAWMASPTHKENIVSINYKDIGVAVMEGELLGKQTILVVQMFGNLTSDVYQVPEAVPSTPTPPPVVKPTVIDSGQIKSISISHPKSGDVMEDPTMLIQGLVTGDKDKYVVEVTDMGESLTEISANGQTWEYSSDEKWTEGEHTIQAQVKGTSVKSEETTFEIDSISPTILRETIQVQKEETGYILTFETDEDWYEVKISNGTEELTFLQEDSESIKLDNFVPMEEVVLYASDRAGNISEIDISEYFLEGTTGEYNNFNIATILNRLATTDGINVIFVGFLLILMTIEVFILWKKGKLGKNIGEIFVIGLWVTVLTIGIFKGFGGLPS